jgi:uncharacterized repeat protein (TIGR03809 family)
MTHQLDVARRRDVVARWCALAEARLEHLTELFETGRWRRYHSERAFLENIQEAKAAVETWRDLSLREASRNNKALDMSGLGRTTVALARSERRVEQVRLPRPAPILAGPPPSIVSIAPQAESPGLSEASLEAVIMGKVRLEEVHFEEVRVEEVPSAPALAHASERTRNIAAAILERYPLLRNTL